MTFTRGAWVNGTQSVTHTVSDNVGVKTGLAWLVDANFDTIGHATTRAPSPAPTTAVALRSGQPTLLRERSRLCRWAVDAAEDAAGSQPATVRVDRTAPAAPGVSVEGGEGSRSPNSFAAVWQNPDEGDGAPIAAAHWRLCRPEGGGCTTGSRSGAGIARLADPKVPEPGEWELRVVREDAPGNRNDGYASQPVRLRHDPEAPALAFGGAPGDDPTRVTVSVRERMSGIAGGRIGLSREGSNTWRSLPTGLEGGRLAAHRRRDAGAGRWYLRARATDLAGNVGVAAPPRRARCRCGSSPPCRPAS